MKGRSLTVRHVSGTHRVALDFDRINLDSKIQIKYINTKNQFTDILTTGNFTCDVWNYLLTLFNISHFNLYCSHRSDGETSSTRIRRRTCHSQITTYDEFVKTQWSSIFEAQKFLCSQILCYVSAKFFNILNATKLGRTELREYEPREATEIMLLSTESRRNSSGIFSQDSQRCSSVTRSAIFRAL